MNGFTIYKEYYELITLLNEKEQQEILLAIMRYMFEDITPNLNERQTKIFNNLKRPLDTAKKNSKRRTNSKPNENQKETKQKPNENQTKTKSKPNQNQKGNQTKTHQDVNVIVNVNKDVLEKIEYEEEKPLVTDDVDLLTEITKKVVEHLNERNNSNFRPTTKTTKQKISARLNEGYKLDDFIVVIDKKSKEWKNTEFEKFLCPETLFGNKFEKYLNQKDNSNSSKKNVPNWFDQDLGEEEITEDERRELEAIENGTYRA